MYKKLVITLMIICYRILLSKMCFSILYIRSKRIFMLISLYNLVNIDSLVRNCRDCRIEFVAIFGGSGCMT